MLDDVRGQGGEIVGISSTSQADADQASASWGIDFPLLADPSCALVRWWNETGLIKSVIKEDPAIQTIFRDSTTEYAVGMLQPGALALRGQVSEALPGDADVLYTWGSVPSMENVNGAAGRVLPTDAWAAIQLSLAGDYSQSRPEQPLGVLSRGAGMLLFPLLLLARGNFVKLKPFLNDASNDFKLRQPEAKQAAMRKLQVVGAGLGLATAAGLARAPASTAAAWAAYIAFFVSPIGPLTTLRRGFAANAQANKL